MSWPLVRWERLKFLRWVVRNPRIAISSGGYCRSIGMHLKSDDRFRGIDMTTIPRTHWRPRP